MRLLPWASIPSEVKDGGRSLGMIHSRKLEGKVILLFPMQCFLVLTWTPITSNLGFTSYSEDVAIEVK